MSAQLQAALAPAERGQWRTLRRAAWLSDDVLLLASASGRGGGKPGTPRVESSAFAGPGEDIAATRMHEPLPPEIEESLTDLKAFVREGPAAWDAEKRAELLGFFAALGGEFGLTASLAEGLRQVRDALRERRPVSRSDRSVERGVAVERLHRIDPDSFYVRGRAWDQTAPVTALTAVSPEGERVELRDSLTPHPGGEGGFAGLFETAHPTHGDDGWVFEATSGSGYGVEAPAALSPDALRTVFADAALRFPAAEALRERHIFPAVTRINEARRRNVELVELASYGGVPGAPAVSLIVPLQRRVDLVEHQIAQLADDPDLAGCELLYVLDEPDQSESLRELGAELFGLYGLPLRLASATAPVGLPIACTLAASQARGERLVFLGSDVLPDSPGWLRVMSGALDADPTVAAVTAKLLYADGAIDQAGLEYVETAAGWAASHRLAGMHRDVAAAAAGGPVAAASLSCLMIDAAAFERAGGLKGEYSLSDYEGSDLSLRLAEMGLRVHYAPEAELFRLEGLGAESEALGEAHARWLHSRLWADAIAGAAR